MIAARRAGVLLVCAASSATAQRTHLYVEASSPSSPVWSSAITADPGERVTVRIRAVYESQENTTLNLGFGGITHQPTLEGWDSSDRLLAFATNPPPGEDTLGRVYPFSASGQGPGSSTGELTAFVDTPHTLRFAGSRNITPTTNLSWGVLTSQSLNVLNPTGYNSNLDVVMFRYAFVAGIGGRTLLASSPSELVSFSRGLWYPCSGCTAIIPAPVSAETIHPAMITIVPECWSVVSIAALCARRARRRG